MAVRGFALRIVLALLAAASLPAFLAGQVSAAGGESCPNAAVRFGPSAALPDCRAYEQVTPVNKGDEIDLFQRGGVVGHTLEDPDRGYPADSGNEFLLVVKTGNKGRNTYVYRRGEHGWSVTAVSVPDTGVQAMQPTVIDPSAGFSTVALQDEVGSFTEPFAGGSYQLMNLLGPPEGPLATLSDERVNLAVLSNGNLIQDFPQVAGASEGLKRIVFETYDHRLAPGDAGQDSISRALYEMGEGNGPRLVNVADDGSLISPCGAVLGQGAREVPGYSRNAVSGDGRIVIFTAPDPEGLGTGCWNKETGADAPQLYARVQVPDGTLKTLDISGELEAGVSDPTLHPAIYVGASADGTKIFFVTETELTVDDQGHAPELYEYDMSAPEGKRVTRVSRGESGEAEGNIDFVPAISSTEGSEGISVYFVAFGQLTRGLSAREKDTAYLYRYATATGRTSYVATVGSEEYPMTTEGEKSNIWYKALREGQSEDSKNELSSDSDANWFTTPNGDYLVFLSYQPITGYNNEPAPGGCTWDLTNSGKLQSCSEVYRYSAASNTVVCVSCGNGPSSNVDNSLFARSYLERPDANGSPPRPVSEDGSYVFFETANALVPNAQPGNQHVYEWHEGVVSLLSSPDDPGNAFFLGATPSGHDVFIGTHAQLSAADTDVSGDMYDARVDGGFPALAQPSCTGTGCQGVPATPPIFATPASVTFEGVGNAPSAISSSKASARANAQRLKEALRACRQDRSKHKRRRCEARARKRYGKAHKSTMANRRGK